MLRYKTKTRPGLVALYDIRHSGQETERVHSYNPRARMGHNMVCSVALLPHIYHMSGHALPRSSTKLHTIHTVIHYTVCRLHTHTQNIHKLYRLHTQTM